MALLPILTLPDPRLRKVSELVDRIDAEIHRLLDDMLETMYEAPGIGLAAIQVGAPKRIVVVDVGKTEEERNPLFLINPEIVWASEELSSYNPYDLNTANPQIIIGAQTLHAVGYAMGIQRDALTAPVGAHMVGRASYHAGGLLHRATVLDELATAERPPEP